jgi:hypothetical protein
VLCAVTLAAAFEFANQISLGVSIIVSEEIVHLGYTGTITAISGDSKP